jgi:ferredoxin
MRIHVDRDVCELHGQCAIAAPAVFAIDDAGELRYVSEPADDLRVDVEDAVGACPTQAIEIL